MLQILMMTSGVEVLSLALEEYNHLATEGQTSVRHLKLRLEAVTGQPRFRQRLLCGERIIRDNDALQLPIVLHLVLLSLFAPSPQILDRMTLALQTDDADVVDDFLHQPHDPNQEEASGLSCLCLAARHGSLRSAKLLLEAKALLDKTDSSTAWAPLLWASVAGHAEFTRWLLQSQADIRKAEENGRLLLHSTCFHGEVDVARIFLEAGVDPNVEDAEGRTPLVVATVCEQLEMAQLLLERGVNINCVSSIGATPLHMACAGGRLNAARFLVQRKADLNLRYGRLTALEIASEAAEPDIVQFLSEAAEAAEAEGLARKPKRRRRTKGPP